MPGMTLVVILHPSQWYYTGRAEGGQLRHWWGQVGWNTYNWPIHTALSPNIYMSWWVACTMSYMCVHIGPYVNYELFVRKMTKWIFLFISCLRGFVYLYEVIQVAKVHETAEGRTSTVKWASFINGVRTQPNKSSTLHGTSRGVRRCKMHWCILPSYPHLSVVWRRKSEVSRYSALRSSLVWQGEAEVTCDNLTLLICMRQPV